MPVASDSATHVAPSAVPTASSINLPEGRTLNINVNRGENELLENLLLCNRISSKLKKKMGS